MRLLWLKSDYIIPPDTGGKIRTYNLMKELHKHCDLTYVALKSEPTPNTEPEIAGCASKVVTYFRPDEVKSGMAFYAKVLAKALSPLPYVVDKCRSREIEALQTGFCAGSNGSNPWPTVILSDFLDMSENVAWSTPCPKILFQHNVENVIWRRYAENERHPLKRAYFRFEHLRMKRYEAAACNRFDTVFAVSDEDKATMEKELEVTTPVEVIETGVDVDFFDPAPFPDPVPNRLLFLGSLDWMPNIDGIRWFLEEVYPLVREKNDEVTFDIVGRRPVPEIERLAAVGDAVRLISDVPDVRPFIAESELFVVPLRIGGGSRIKIYEAMAMKRPVLSTTIGAEGLSVNDGREIRLADAPRDLAEATVELFRSREQRANLAANAYRYVDENCRWSSIARNFLELCHETCERYQRRSGEKSLNP